MKCLVEKCCCCLKLTTGGYITGILGIMDAVITFISSIMLLADYDEIITSMKDVGPELVKLLLENKTTFMGILWVCLVMCVILFVVSVLLIQGTFKRIPKLHIPSLIMFGVAHVLLLAVFIIYLFLENVPPPYILPLVLLLGLNIYTWICLYSLYKSLKSFQAVPTA